MRHCYTRTVLAAMLLAPAILCAQLSGEYTIGGTSPDYADFTSAIADLDALGVSGPVTFLVQDGVYEESLVFGEISGSSATNTITFKGASEDYALATLQWPNDGSNASWEINGMDGLHFEHLTIANSGSDYYDLFEVEGDIDDLVFRNCRITSTQPKDEYFIYGSVDRMDGLRIINCMVDSMYVFLEIDANVDSIYNVTIEGCTFPYVEYLVYADDLVNTVLRNNTIGYGYDVFEIDYGRNLIVEGNTVSELDDDFMDMYEIAGETLIRGNTMIGGDSDNISLDYMDNVTIEDNVFRNQESYITYIYEVENLIIRNNEIWYPEEYVIEIDYVYGDLIISGNTLYNDLNENDNYGLEIDDVYASDGDDVRIFNNHFIGLGEYTGMELSDIECSPSNPGLIYNNTISGFEYGMDLYSCENLVLAHNTISAFGESYTALYAYGNTDLEFINNIVSYRPDPGYEHDVLKFDDPTEFAVMNGNVYHYDESNLAITFNEVEDAFDDWQLASGHDANSQIADPMFYDDEEDLRICNTAIADAGQPSFVTMDYFGTPRNTSMPTPGAYEYIALVADFDWSSDGLSIGFLNTSTAGAQSFYWEFGDGSTSNDPNPTHTYTALGTYTVTLTVTDGCGSIETATFDVSVPSGLETAESLIGAAWPNPTQGAVFLQLERRVQNATLQVFDLHGRLYLERPLNNIQPGEPFRVDLSGLAAGLYVVRIASEEINGSIRLLKQ